MSDTQELILTAALRDQTRAAHEKLDHYLTNLGLFNDVNLYKQFLTLQYYIHHEANTLYTNPSLEKIIPDLSDRNRFEKVIEDLQDLQLPIPTPLPTTLKINNPSKAVGFLYVVEGSKLGANTLLKRVEKIGLSENFGARHMGPDKEGRGVSWKKFQASIDHAKLDIHDAIEGAKATFNQILSYAKHATT